MIDTLMDEAPPVFDRQKLLIPSFIERVPATIQTELVADIKFGGQKQRSQSRGSQGDTSTTLKIKSRIGSANMANAFKEKFTVKRGVQQRNQNASQLNSQGSDQQVKEKVIIHKVVTQQSQPYLNNIPMQQIKVRQNSQASQERFLGTSLNLASQQRTIDPRQSDGTCKLKIAVPNQRNQANANLPQSSNASATKTQKRLLNQQRPQVHQQPNLTVLHGQTERIKNQPRPNVRPGMNMFQTMNDVPPSQKITHQRTSSKSSSFQAPQTTASDLTTERNKPHLLSQLACKAGNHQRENQVQICLPNRAENDDDEQNILQCSLDVQNTIHTVAPERNLLQFTSNGCDIQVGDMNQILSDFLNEQKINLYLQGQQAKNIKSGGARESSTSAAGVASQSRQMHQQLLEQDSLESQAFEEEFAAIQQNQTYELVESQQAYFNEQDQLAQSQMRELLQCGVSEQQYQQQVKQRAIKHIQTKSMHAFVALTNQKKQAVNILAKNQANQVKRQNYVNSYHTNSNLQDPRPNVKQGNSQILYGTFDNSLVSKTQFDAPQVQKIERGSSVGDQFYTIDNTQKENNSHSLNKIIDYAPQQQQRQQLLIRKSDTQYGTGLDGGAQTLQLLSSQQRSMAPQQSHLKIKNLGLKIKANHQQIALDGQRVTNAQVPERLRSNSNNMRPQPVNNRYGESNDEYPLLDSNSSLEELY
ncbi:hypothetical protein FGO68_gene15057 [Halteria grandinella]|uniref:Uncharacterized protein n=1 Tax=Halteria grandinella TaxID=5974 RepID=A0A8J8P425_HALGN|nr:hypothetical protein FGO68_gene15057 [Halteria grandinella]